MEESAQAETEETKQDVAVDSTKASEGKKKAKSKKVKVNVQVNSEDHGEAKQEDKEDKAGELQADMGTLFILDLMRQKREKLMRKKKDDLINQLAMQKKQQMMEARMGKRQLTRPAFGGFVGVSAILAGSKNTSPVMRRRTPKPVQRDPEVDIPPTERTDLLIMGILRDKKEEEFHEKHHVKMEQAGVPSDDRWLAKFGD